MLLTLENERPSYVLFAACSVNESDVDLEVALSA